ncbi:MAG: hypothetical protein AAF539_12715, partial [Planctomycetota bacterium]
GIAGVFFRLSQIAFSQERLLARAGERASKIKTVVEPESPANESLPPPTVPRVPPQSESPGERLRYRLASSPTGRWSLFGAASLALAWNSVCVVLLAVVISGWWADRNRPVLAMLLIFFVGVAVWSLRTFRKRLRQIVGVGPTLVEISDHPLEAGGNYDVYVAQMGRMTLSKFRVRLVCEEETYFREGTDVRAEKHTAFSRDLWTGDAVCVDPRRPWEQQLTIEMPANAMHSFNATHNAVRWQLVVSGDADPWPSFCRSFPVLVYPPLMAPPAIPR